MWNGGGSQTQTRSLESMKKSSTARCKPPPLARDFQPPKIQVPDGFAAELVAGPPLVTHPTMGCFDDRGRLFICNNAGVNLSRRRTGSSNFPTRFACWKTPTATGGLISATVFADKMTYPMGAPGTMGLFTWHRRLTFGGWKTPTMTASRMSRKISSKSSATPETPRAFMVASLGPTAELYWCDGYHGHEFHDENGNITSQRDGSYMFSCRTMDPMCESIAAAAWTTRSKSTLPTKAK